MLQDQIALETHDYIATKAERIQKLHEECVYERRPDDKST